MTLGAWRGYTFAMPSKIKPSPVRLGDERRVLVDAYASANGLSQHKALLALIDKGLGVDTAPPAPPTRKAPPKKAPPAPEPGNPASPSKLDTSMVPQAGAFEVRPLQKAAPKRKWKV